MRPFLGTHQNRLDAKGRVSIPAAFRAELKTAAGPDGLVLRPSHKHPCIEAWPASTFNTLAIALDGHDLFSQDYDDLAAALYADAYPIEPDKEGRVMLPECLATHANLNEAADFVGFGRYFLIWEPAAGQAFRDAARKRAHAGGVPTGMAAGA